MTYQVLLLHGFTGSRRDMLPLLEELEGRGMNVSLPELPGHGTHPEDLLSVTMEDWVFQAQEALAHFQPDQPKIIVALSMGTFLAALLAADKENKIDALVLLSPAFALSRTGRLAVLLSRLGIHHFLRFFPKRKGSDICDPEARRLNTSYRKVPAKSLLEFDNLRKIAIQNLKNVTCPTLIIFGKHDRTVDIPRARKELRKIGSSQVQTRLYDNSAHVLPLDYDRLELCKEVADFIELL